MCQITSDIFAYINKAHGSMYWLANWLPAQTCHENIKLIEIYYDSITDSHLTYNIHWSVLFMFIPYW